MTDFGDIWKPVTKGGAYPAHYFRKKHVARSSPAVKEVNVRFTKAAKSCEGLSTADKSFQQCIRKEMLGYSAPSRKPGTAKSRRARVSRARRGYET